VGTYVPTLDQLEVLFENCEFREELFFEFDGICLPWFAALLQCRNQDGEVILLRLLDLRCDLVLLCGTEGPQVMETVAELPDDGPRTPVDDSSEVLRGSFFSFGKLGQRSNIQRDVFAEVDGEPVGGKQVSVFRQVVKQ